APSGRRAARPPRPSVPWACRCRWMGRPSSATEGPSATGTSRPSRRAIPAALRWATGAGTLPAPATIPRNAPAAAGSAGATASSTPGSQVTTQPRAPMEAWSRPAPPGGEGGRSGGPAGGDDGQAHQVGEPVVVTEGQEPLPHPLHHLADGGLTQAEAGGDGDGGSAVARGHLLQVGQPHRGVAGAGDLVERGGQLGRPAIALGHPPQCGERVLVDVFRVDGPRGGRRRETGGRRRVAGGEHLVERVGEGAGPVPHDAGDAVARPCPRGRTVRPPAPGAPRDGDDGV